MIKEYELRLLRRTYQPGTVVVLDEMDDPFTVMPKGMTGTVKSVDDTGTIFVSWENGSSLGVVYGIDRCHVLKEEESA